MSVGLLDVNVLIALLWPSHEAHRQVQDWFGAHSATGWATCPLTQAGFVRIVSNPAFSPDALAPAQAVSILAANLKHRSHQFWEDDVSLADAVAGFRPRLVGHRQVTDAYLLGLALGRNGCLVTLDRRVATLLPDGSARSAVQVV